MDSLDTWQKRRFQSFFRCFLLFLRFFWKVGAICRQPKHVVNPRTPLLFPPFSWQDPWPRKKNSDGKGEFAEDPEMGCRQGPPLSPEERRAQAPDVLFFDSPTMRCASEEFGRIFDGSRIQPSTVILLQKQVATQMIIKCMR